MLPLSVASTLKVAPRVLGPSNSLICEGRNPGANWPTPPSTARAGKTHGLPARERATGKITPSLPRTRPKPSIEADCPQYGQYVQ